MSSLPRPSHAISGTSQPDKLYYDWFLSVERRLTQLGVSKEYIDVLIKQIATQLGSPDGSIAHIPTGANDVLFFGGDGIRIDGSFSSGAITVSLQQVADSGTGSLKAIVRDAWGRITGTKAATITGTTGRVVVANGDASAGLPTIDLATVTNAGGGTLQKTVFDSYGRNTGNSSATTSDLPEGSNLYYTNSRVDARIAAVSPAQVFNRIDGGGDLRIDGNGDLRISS